MKPETKTFAIIFGYCLVLWMTNWTVSHSYARDVGLTESSLDMRGLGAIIGVVASIILTRRIWRVTRILFDEGVRIPSSMRLWGSWHYLLLVLPLAYGVTYHSSGIDDDGAAIKTVFEYGGFWASPLFSGLAIMLFQLLIRLEAFNLDNSPSRTSRTIQPQGAVLFR
jgi:hypothetical protein